MMGRNEVRHIEPGEEVVAGDDRIPCDPERMTFPADPEMAALKKWRHYALTVIGRAAMRELSRAGLVVVPREFVPALSGDGSPTRTDQSADPQSLAGPIRNGQ